MEKQIENWYCEKCNKTMSVDMFYQSNNLEKYPDRYLNQCKKCITMHVDNWNPKTYMWILQEADVPYIPEEWNKLLSNFGRNKKTSGATIIGRYLSKMKLQQFNEFRWKDTEYLQKVANNKIEQAMKRQGYDAQQIAEAIDKATFPLPEGPIEKPVYDDDKKVARSSSPMPSYASDEDAVPSQYVMPTAAEYDGEHGWVVQEPADTVNDEIISQLTDEDKSYLRLKWGKAYKPEEWIWLEKLYNEMLDSYDIQTAGHFDTLKMICKTSLKSNQLLDIGDVDGSMKMIKMYDQLMKSGKFTAAQNKAENGEFVDSVSELTAYAEQYGFIPRFYTDGPQDKADRVLQDMQSYTKDLVFNDSNLGNMIENALKGIIAQKEKEASSETAAAGDEDDILEQELFGQQQEEITDEDFEELADLEDVMEAADDEYLSNLLKGGTIS